MLTSIRQNFLSIIGLLAMLLLLLLAIAYGTADASDATPRKRCELQGRAVALTDATHAPDYRVNLTRGQSRTPSHANTELHAYARSGGRSQTYVCGGRTEWRTVRGTLLATYDGRTVRAHRSIVLAGWHS